MREMQHASDVKRYLKLFNCYLSNFCPVYVPSCRKVHTQDLFPENVYRMHTIDLSQNFHLSVSRLLKKCLVKCQLSSWLLTKPRLVVCCNRSFSAEATAIFRACDGSSASMKVEIPVPDLCINFSRGRAFSLLNRGLSSNRIHCKLERISYKWTDTVSSHCRICRPSERIWEWAKAN